LFPYTTLFRSHSFSQLHPPNDLSRVLTLPRTPWPHPPSGRILQLASSSPWPNPPRGLKLPVAQPPRGPTSPLPNPPVPQPHRGPILKSSPWPQTPRCPTSTWPQ